MKLVRSYDETEMDAITNPRKITVRDVAHNEWKCGEICGESPSLCRVHNITPLVLTLSQTNPFHIVTPWKMTSRQEFI
jgi:hypothetical protein